MDDILQKFIENTPVAVIFQATAARAIGDSVLNGIFERNAQAQYTREVAFSTVADLTAQVVLRGFRSVHAAYRAKEKEIPVSITSIYNKLNGLEPGISQALVAETACTMSEVFDALPMAPIEEPVTGLRLRTLDGNFLAGTDHRIDCLRANGAAALPGMSLVVRDGRTGLLTDIVPVEDAYTNERSLYPELLTLVKRNDLWLADRNFCTDDYLSGIAARDAFFLIRHHAGTTLHPLGPETLRRSHSGGTISEQKVRVGFLECRCIIIRLKKPLRDGSTEIRLLTNVPKDRLSAKAASELYRTRWQIETAFQELTDNLRCEINTLGYPKAALFGFALAMVAYNLMVFTRAGVAAGVGEEISGPEVISTYYLALEVASTTRGMLIAVPPSEWQRFVEMTAAEFTDWLYHVTSKIDWRPYRKSPRGPKKPVDVKRTKRGAHRSTARELLKYKK
jgi:IS4 transposase